MLVSDINHWGLVTDKWTGTLCRTGLSPFTWTNTDLLLIWSHGAEVNAISFEIQSLPPSKCIRKYLVQNGSQFISAFI